VQVELIGRESGATGHIAEQLERQLEWSLSASVETVEEIVAGAGVNSHHTRSIACDLVWRSVACPC